MESVTHRLNADSPRMVWSTSMVSLYMHQLAEMHKMRCIEASSVTAIPMGTTVLASQIGILCSQPASGKSGSILATIASNPVAFPSGFEPARRYTSMGGVVSMVTKDSESIMLSTNIIVVPRAILHQWTKYVDLFTDIPPRRVMAKPSLNRDDVDRVFSGEMVLVIVAERAMRVILDDPRYHRHVFSRIVLDEADSICIPTWSSFPRAYFTWLVTASVSNLLSGNSRTMFVKDFFRNCSVASSPRLAGALMVHSDPVFIQSSVHIPPFVERLIRIRRRVTFADVMPPSAVNALNADDVSGAIAAIGCQTVKDTDCLLAAVCHKIEEELIVVQRSIADAPVSAIPDLVARLRTLESKKSAVCDRIRDTGVCPITFEPIDTKAVVPCCSNAFEMLGLMKAINVRPMCPMCRSAIDPSTIVVQMSDDTQVQRNDVVMPNKRAALTQELVSILDDPNSRILVYSSWDFYMIRGSCLDAGIDFVLLKGHTSTIVRILEDFRAGRTRVLFMDAVAYGAGLNLEFATHLIFYHRLDAEQNAQVMGRTQRPGRGCPLTVINLRYDNEL